MGNSTKVGSLVVDVDGDISKLRTEMRAAVGVLQTAATDMQARSEAMRNGLESVLNPIKSITDKLGPLAAGFGTILSLNAFGEMVKGATDAAEKLHDLASQTGVTVEALSALEEIGKYTDTSLDTIASTMNKLSKNSAVMTEEGKGAGAALRALGIDFDSFRNMSPDEQMMTVAKAMDNFSDGGGKSAAAMALMGKEGAALIPFMKDLAAAGELQATVTTEQAAMADNFNDNMTRIQVTGEAWKKQLSMSLLPVMSELSEAWILATTGSDGLGGSIKRNAADGTFAEWARTAVTGVTYLIDVGQGLLSLLPMIGKGIAGMAAMSSAAFGAIYDAYLKVKDGDLGGAWDELKKGAREVQGVAVATGEDISKIWNQDLLGEKIRKGMEEVRNARKVIAAEEKKPTLNASDFDKGNDDEKKADSAKKRAAAYATLIRSINEKTAAQELEVMSEGNVTEGQKLAMKVMVDIRDDVLKLTDAEKSNLALTLERYLAQEQLAISHKEMLALGASMVKAGDDQVKSLDAQLEAAQKSNDEMGLTKEQVEQLSIKKLGLAAASDEELASNMRLASEYAGDLKDAYLVYANSLDLAAKKKRDLMQIKADGIEKQKNIEETNRGLKEQIDIWNSVENTVHETYKSITDGGKDVVTRLRESFKNGFFDWLYQMTIKKWFINVSAGLTTTASGSAFASAGDGSLSSMLSAGKSLWDGFSAAGTIGGGISQMGSTFGISAVSQFGAGMAGYGSAGVGFGAIGAQGAASSTFLSGAGTTFGGVSTGLSAPVGGATAAAGAGSSMAAALPIVGWVIAGMMANNSLFDKGWGGKGSNETKQYGIAAGMIGGAFENTIQKMFGLSDKTASMLSGSAVVNRLFGHKNKELQQSELSGSFGSGGYSASTRDVYKQQGGVFRSDKWSQDVNAVGDTKGMSDVFTSIKQAAAGYASVLGLSATALENYTKSFSLNLSITGDAAKDAEANKKLMSDLIVGMTDDISSLLAPSIKSFTKEGETASTTLARLAGNLTGVNAVVGALGMGKFAQSLDGANGAQKLLEATGGFEKFSAGAAYFTENFLSESEKMKPSIDAVASTLASLGMSNLKSVEDFKLAVVGGKDANGNLVKGLDLTTEAGTKTFAQLMAISPQFKAVADYTNTLSGSLSEVDEKLKKTNEGWQQQIDALEKAKLSQGQLREAELIGVADSTKLLIGRVHALEDEATASEKAKAAAEKLQATNEGLEAQIDALVKASLPLEKQRELELIGVADSTKLLIGRVHALEDEATASEKAKAAAEKLQATNEGLEARIDALVKASLPLEKQRELELIGVADSTKSLIGRVHALEDEATASEKAKAAAEKLQATNEGLEARIDALVKASLPLEKQRELELVGVADSTKLLIGRVHALEDEATASEKAKAAAEKLQATNEGLEARIDALVKASLPLEKQRELELIGVADSTKLLIGRVHALEDEATASAKAKAAIEKLKATNDSIQQQIDAMVRSSLPLEEQRRLEIEGVDGTTAALKGQLWALEDAKQSMLDKAALDKKSNDDRLKAEQEAQAVFGSWMSEVKNAFSTESGVFKNIIDEFGRIGESLKTYRGSLDTGKFAMLTAEDQYKADKAAWEKLLVLIDAGDQAALERFQSVTDAFLESSLERNASSAEYFQDYEAAKKAAEKAVIAAYTQVDAAKLQLTYLEQQVQGLFAINESVKSLASLLADGKSNVAMGVFNPNIGSKNTIREANGLSAGESTMRVMSDRAAIITSRPPPSMLDSLPTQSISTSSASSDPALVRLLQRNNELMAKLINTTGAGSNGVVGSVKTLTQKFTGIEKTAVLEKAKG